MRRLEQELATFEKMRSRLLKEHEGRFVVIRRSTILGVFSTSDEAFTAAMQAYGHGAPFLLRRLTALPEAAEAPALCLGLLALPGL